MKIPDLFAQVARDLKIAAAGYPTFAADNYAAAAKAAQGIADAYAMLDRAFAATAEAHGVKVK